MMRKKTNFTNVTPIPSFIPRQLAIDMLHNHSEVITLNPLVLEHHPTKAPRDAPADEFYSTWYEITERIQFIPGIGKMGSGKISFKGVFHDMPWGLQTHIYAPMDIDMRNKWQIAGNQPGEPSVPQELGIGAPPEGLYLREDIEIKCNLTMISFVKKEMKAASKIMVDRMIKKAELLDAGLLHAMFENGKLKTVNPADRSNTMSSPRPGSASVYNNPLRSPTLPPQGFGEPPGAQTQPASQGIAMELPGDFYHAGQQPGTPGQQQGHLQAPLHDRYSMNSNPSMQSPNLDEGNWSDRQSVASSRPTSYTSDGLKSPTNAQGNFTAELPAHQESREEYDAAANKRLEASNQQNFAHGYQPYRPAETGHERHRSNPQTQKWQEMTPNRKGSQRMIFP